MSEPTEEKRITWHRLFGLALQDYLLHTVYEVETELELARKRQLLDILIIRRSGAGEPLTEPCDGLEGLRSHNLLTYKSDHESLDYWAIEELIGHYVNYRKVFAPKTPPEAFGLYAVTTRYPRKLLQNTQALVIRPGVYQLKILSQSITIIVLKRVAAEPRNALWELFSFEAERIREGMQAYQWRDEQHIQILHELYHKYHEKGFSMGYTFEDFRRDVALEVLPTLPPEELLQKFSPEDRLKGLSPEELLKRLSPEERLKGLASEELLKRLSPKELLQGLSVEQLQQFKALLAEEGEEDRAKKPGRKKPH